MIGGKVEKVDDRNYYFRTFFQTINWQSKWFAALAYYFKSLVKKLNRKRFCLEEREEKVLVHKSFDDKTVVRITPLLFNS